MVNNEHTYVKTCHDANKLEQRVDKTNSIIFHSPQQSLEKNFNIMIRAYFSTRILNFC